MKQSKIEFSLLTFKIDDICNCLKWLLLSCNLLFFYSTSCHAQLANCRTMSTGSGCNHIANNTFQEPPYPAYLPSLVYDHNFLQGNIPHWVQADNCMFGYVTNFVAANANGYNYSHVPLPPVTQATDYALLHAVARSNNFTGTDLNQNIPVATTIVQKIKPLSSGGNYSLSFFKMLFPLSQTDSFVGLDQVSHMAQFRIVLMHCSEFIHPQNGVGIYTEPSNSQIIYEEFNVDNDLWEQVVTCFTPDDDYDLIMIQPLQTDYEFNLPIGNNAARSVAFAYPQIFEQSALSIQVTEANSPANCLKKLSSSCIDIPNASYSWFLNGNSTPFSTSNEPIIDASAVFGTISLVITLPNTGHGFCTNRIGTITIPQCNNMSSNLDCSPVASGTSCNLIRNNEFDAPNFSPALYPAQLTDVFGLNLVTDWLPSHGTADLYNPMGGLTQPLPPAGINTYVRMGTSWDTQFVSDRASEGIMQKIPALTPGTKYVFSFYRRIESAADFPFSGDPVDFFKVSLMKCTDINFPQANSNYWPPILPNHQNIYCESTVINQTWEQVVIQFTANNSWNMIMVYAHPTFNGPNTSGALYFAHPTLIVQPVIDAGPDVNPIHPNCTVTIGSENNAVCTLENAVFQWVSPTGSIVPTSSPVDQQIVIDASVDPGIWTLELIVPNAAINYNSCNVNMPSPSQVVASAQVNVGDCPKGVWPKVYASNGGGIEISSMAVGSEGNIFMIMPNAQPTLNLNHSGPLPTNTGFGHYSFQYDAFGDAKWFYENLMGNIQYMYHSTDINMCGQYMPSVSTYALDGANGNLMSQPWPLNNNELIVAELPNSGYITRDYNTFYVINSSGFFTLNITGGIIDCKFNPALNTLTFLAEEANGHREIYNYLLSGTQLTINHHFAWPTNASDGWLIVDNADNCYYLDHNRALMKIDHVTQFGSPVSFSGFANNDLFKLNRIHTYTSDEFLVFNRDDKNLYYLNFDSMVSKKLSTSNYDPVVGHYGIHNGNIYLMGAVFSSMTIGNQQIDPVSYSSPDVFLTNLSLHSDFQRIAVPRNRGDIVDQIDDLLLHPNPASSIVTITSKNPIEFVVIANILGTSVMKIDAQNSNTLQFDTNELLAGTYQCLVYTQHGIKSKMVTVVK